MLFRDPEWAVAPRDIASAGIETVRLLSQAGGPSDAATPSAPNARVAQVRDPVLNDDESATENLELWATYFDVPPAPGVFRIDLPYPGNCTF